MKQRGGDKFVRVVVLVRREQFTEQFIVNITICGGSQIVRKTWGNFQTGKPTLAAVFNKAPSDIGDVQVWKLIWVEVDKGEASKRPSTETLQNKKWNRFSLISGHEIKH